MRSKMDRCIRQYDQSRHKEPKIPNESWATSKYGPNAMNWREAKEVYLPSVKMSVGKTWFRVRKLWQKYKIQGSTGQYRGDTAYEINRLLTALDLPRIDFPELEGVVSDYEFQDQETNEISEPHPEEWSDLDEQLTREAQEAQSEAKAEDDWWFSDD